MITAKYIEKIEAIRKEQKVSIKSLAKKAGIPSSYYSRIKSGEIKNMTVDKLAALTGALGYTINFKKKKTK